MKKTLALLLALVSCLSLCACGGGSSASAPSKDELLAVAEEVSFSDLSNDTNDNMVSAQALYCDKDILISGFIEDIKPEYALMTPGVSGAPTRIELYFPSEELMKLEKHQRITVVGHTDGEIKEVDEEIMGMNFSYYHYAMPTVYFVGNRFDVSGSLFGPNNSYAPAWNFLLPNSNTARLVYFNESVDTSALDWKQEITFNAEMYYNNGYEYRDAVIVE